MYLDDVALLQVPQLRIPEHLLLLSRLVPHELFEVFIFAQQRFVDDVIEVHQESGREFRLIGLA